MKYIVTLNGKNYEVEVDKAQAVLPSPLPLRPPRRRMSPGKRSRPPCPAPLWR